MLTFGRVQASPLSTQPSSDTEHRTMLVLRVRQHVQTASRHTAQELQASGTARQVRRSHGHTHHHSASSLLTIAVLSISVTLENGMQSIVMNISVCLFCKNNCLSVCSLTHFENYIAKLTRSYRVSCACCIWPAGLAHSLSAIRENGVLYSNCVTRGRHGFDTTTDSP